MKKKILAIVIASVCAVSAIYYSVSSKKKNSSTASKNTSQSILNFKVKSAFADIDSDMTIEDKDSKDDDTSADYIFITFTAQVTDNKKNDDTNPYYIKNYKLDGKDLPAESKIYPKYQNELVIKLPNDCLKGLNTAHTLDISKNLVDNAKDKLTGDINLKLPYSSSVENTSNSSDTKNANSSNNNTSTNTTNNSKNNNSTSGSKDNSSNKGTVSADTNIPKYTVELGKGIPYITIIVVKLDTPDPKNFKVSIEGNELELKKNGQGEMVFAKGIKKIYELDEVKKLLKIQKVQ